MSTHPPRAGQQSSLGLAARFGAGLLLGLIVACTSSSNQPPARPLYDGVYVGGDYPYGCVVTGTYRATYPERWDFLRFYADGTVIEEVGPLFITPSNSRKFLTKENKHANRRGSWSVDGNRISFVTTVGGGESAPNSKQVDGEPIHSSGRIKGDRLILKRRGGDAESGHGCLGDHGKSAEYVFHPYGSGM